MQVKEEGWLPQHVLVREEGSGELLGAVPLYLKSHSYGGAAPSGKGLHVTPRPAEQQHSRALRMAWTCQACDQGILVCRVCL